MYLFHWQITDTYVLDNYFDRDLHPHWFLWSQSWFAVHFCIIIEVTAD